MRKNLAILEDDARRIQAMRSCVAEISPGIELAFFTDAQAMILWLGQHLGDVGLISLDHDLPLRNAAGTVVDCGTGRQVVDFLTSFPPTCPVIIHSSNDACASGMFFALKKANWICSRVYPRDDLAWVKDAWATQVRRYMDNSRMTGNGTVVMMLNPQQLLERLTAILPEFADHWASPDNLFRNDDGSFTLWGVFAQCADFVRSRYEKLSRQQRRDLADFVEQCMTPPGTDIGNAAATCFLENLTGEAFSRDWESHLRGNAQSFVQKMSGV